MLRISFVLVAAALAVVALGGCQTSLCDGPEPFAYAAAPAAPERSITTDNPWIMAAPQSIQLTEAAYEKKLDLCAFGCDWFEAYQPVYRTKNGTEMVRGFLGEAPFLARNLMVESNINWTDNGPKTEGFATIPGRGEDWMSADLEFAFTRRLQINAMLPVSLTDGDVPFWSIGGRALLYDADGLIVSTNLDVDISDTLVDWTPTVNMWYDLGNFGLSYWAFQSSIGAQLRDDVRSDEMLWTGGLSNSFTIGTTGRWDAILEGGYKDGDWQAGLGFVKPLEFLHPDVDLRAAVLRNFDSEDWTINLGVNWRF